MPQPTHSRIAIFHNDLQFGDNDPFRHGWWLARRILGEMQFLGNNGCEFAIERAMHVLNRPREDFRRDGRVVWLNPQKEVINAQETD